MPARKHSTKKHTKKSSHKRSTTRKVSTKRSTTRKVSTKRSTTRKVSTKRSHGKRSHGKRKNSYGQTVSTSIDSLKKCEAERLGNRQMFNVCSKQIEKLQKDLADAQAQVAKLNKGMEICRKLTAKKQ
jgi:hypothetical protein